jgi:hypothetical protein
MGNQRTEASCKEQWKRMNANVKKGKGRASSRTNSAAAAGNAADSWPLSRIRSLRKAVSLSKTGDSIDWVNVYLYFDRQGSLQEYQDMWNQIKPNRDPSAPSIHRQGVTIDWSADEVKTHSLCSFLLLYSLCSVSVFFLIVSQEKTLKDLLRGFENDLSKVDWFDLMNQFKGTNRRVMEIYQKSLSLLQIQPSSPAPPPAPTPIRKGKFHQEEIDRLTSAISLSRYQNHQIDWLGVLLLMKYERKLQSYIDAWKFLSQNKNKTRRNFLPINPSASSSVLSSESDVSLSVQSSSSSSPSSVSASASSSSSSARWTEEELNQLNSAVKSNYHPDGTISWGGVAVEMRSQRSVNSLRCQWNKMNPKENEKKNLKVLWSKSEEKKFLEVVRRNGGEGEPPAAGVARGAERGEGGRSGVDWKQVMEEMGSKRSLGGYKAKWQKLDKTLG